MVQGELFIEDTDSTKTQNLASFFSKNQCALSFDKIVLLLIGSLVLFVLTYSFGYERGHRAADQKIQAMTAHIETVAPNTELSQPAAPKTADLNQVPEEMPVETVERTDFDNLDMADREAAETDPATNSIGKYTIQVSTAVSKKRADQEVAKLVEKGFVSFFVQRGRYFEICVGGFDTVAAAKSLLNEFHTKGPYLDAFVRPNPNL